MGKAGVEVAAGVGGRAKGGKSALPPFARGGGTCGLSRRNQVRCSPRLFFVVIEEEGRMAVEASLYLSRTGSREPGTRRWSLGERRRCDCHSWYKFSSWVAGVRWGRRACD